MQYVSVKVPLWVYDNALATQSEVFHRGLGAVPESLLHPKDCPLCGRSLTVSEATPRTRTCRLCGYVQCEPDPSRIGLGLGMTFGLAIAAYLRSLGGKPVDVERLRDAAESHRILREAQKKAKKGVRKADIDRVIKEVRKEIRERGSSSTPTSS